LFKENDFLLVILISTFVLAEFVEKHWLFYCIYYPTHKEFDPPAGAKTSTFFKIAIIRNQLPFLH